MFSYVFMKLLERRPPSYDRQMDRSSGGRVLQIKKQVASQVQPGWRVLELGCGTGELASMMVAGGASVLGFDLSPAMVDFARKRADDEGLEQRFQVEEMGVDGMDSLEANSFDAVVSTLVFSELSTDERRFALEQSLRVLRDDGRLVLADEVLPRSAAGRTLHAMVRAPMLALTYLVTSTGTKPIPDLAEEVQQAGFTLDQETRSHGDSFALVLAHRPPRTAATEPPMDPETCCTDSLPGPEGDR